MIHLRSPYALVIQLKGTTVSFFARSVPFWWLGPFVLPNKKVPAGFRKSYGDVTMLVSPML